MKSLITLTLFCSLYSCNKNDSTYYFRSESSKLNDPQYQKMEKMFYSLSEKDQGLLEEIVMEKLAGEKTENAEDYFEPESYDGR